MGDSRIQVHLGRRRGDGRKPNPAAEEGLEGGGQSKTTHRGTSESMHQQPAHLVLNTFDHLRAFTPMAPWAPELFPDAQEVPFTSSRRHLLREPFPPNF